MKSEYKWLILFFVIALSFRLFFAFQTPSFTGDEAYFNLRQVENIKENFIPLYDDPLSYGGRTLSFLPIFHYLLAIFNLFLPITLVGKIIPNILASSLVLVIFLLSKRITNSKNISLFTSFVSIFIPIYLTETINKVSTLSLLIPFFFLLVYLLLEINKHSTFFVIGCFILALISPVASILALALGIYLILAKVEDVKIEEARLESILFFIFISVWAYIIFFKDAFLASGASIIWRNIPELLLNQYFTSANVIELMLLIGIIPFVCGVYSVYRYFFVEKSRPVYIFTSLAITIFLLLFFKLLTPELGAVFLGVTLVVLLSPCLNFIFKYVAKTKFSNRIPLFAILIFIIFVFNSVIPSFVYSDLNIKSSVSDDTIEALEWISENTEENTTVLADVHKGHLITSIADRKNVIDTNFLNIPDAEIRLDDVNTVYNAKFQTIALDLLAKYDVDYIYLEDTPPDYLNSECFEKVYNKNVLIYEVGCYG